MPSRASGPGVSRFNELGLSAGDANERMRSALIPGRAREQRRDLGLEGRAGQAMARGDTARTLGHRDFVDGLGKVDGLGGMLFHGGLLVQVFSPCKSGTSMPHVTRGRSPSRHWGVALNAKPETTLAAYLRAFESLDPDAIVPFYRLPCMFIAATGVTIVPDAAGARGVASKLIEHARSQDYRRTEILNLEVRMLAEQLASLSGLFARFNSSEEEISRFGFAYTMLRADTGWQIVVAIAHAAPSAQA